MTPTENSHRAAPLALAVLLAAAPSLALPAAIRHAKGEFRAGKQAYDLGRFDEALTAYSESYRLNPAPEMLFNIAQCHRNLGNHEQALFFFNRYLSAHPMRPVPNEKLVAELIAEVEEQKAKKEEAARQAAEVARLTELESARQQAAQAEREAASQRLEQPASRLAPPLAPQQPATTGELTAPGPTPVASATPLYRQWWLWVGVGVVAAAVGGTTAYVVTAPHPRPTSLGEITAQ